MNLFYFLLQNPLDKPLIDFGAGEDVDQASANLTNLSKFSSNNYFGTHEIVMKFLFSFNYSLYIFILSSNLFCLF